MIRTDGFVIELLDKLDLLLKNFVFDGYSALVDYLRAPIGALMMLAIIIMGLLIQTGQKEVSVKAFSQFIATAAIIYGVALNWDIFSLYVIQFLQVGIADNIGARLIEANPISIPVSSDINHALQWLFSSVFDLGTMLFKEVKFSGGYVFGIYGLSVWILGYLLAMIALIEIAMAKIMMAILFTMAPIIIPLALFKRTESIVNHWVGHLAGYVLLLIFVSAFLGLFMGMIYWSFPVIEGQTKINVEGLADAVLPFLATSFLFIILLLRISGTAIQIGGGISSGSAASAFIGGTMATTFGGSKLLGALGQQAGRLGKKMGGGLATLAGAASYGTVVAAKKVSGQLSKLRRGD